jgi:hypothetical protein
MVSVQPSFLLAFTKRAQRQGKGKRSAKEKGERERERERQREGEREREKTAARPCTRWKNGRRRVRESPAAVVKGEKNGN